MMTRFILGFCSQINIDQHTLEQTSYVLEGEPHWFSHTKQERFVTVDRSFMFGQKNPFKILADNYFPIITKIKIL